jgi:hypothetical protein
MISIQEHPDFDVLNDFVDERLDQESRTVVAKHLETCDDCQREHRELRKLLESAGSVPTSVLPTEDLWEGIRSSIDVRKEVVLPVGNRGPSARNGQAGSHELTRPWWAYRSLLAAAAVALIVASSGVTALVLRSDNGSITAAPGRDSIGVFEARVLPAAFRRAESEYLRTIAELRATLQSQRDVLRPETVATVEHSLSVVDSAIEEARTALLLDPGNVTLVDLLTASYERKVELLRRAADLGART